uniref:hypothetical protein n=1 Tax=Thaumasiovibrio occultus TaxID=1891184 RepID=UPI00131D7FCB|nr:hypothetical protein [Thaumasiovibrio occultus]
MFKNLFLAYFGRPFFYLPAPVLIISVFNAAQVNLPTPIRTPIASVKPPFIWTCVIPWLERVFSRDGSQFASKSGGFQSVMRSNTFTIKPTPLRFFALSLPDDSLAIDLLNALQRYQQGRAQ